MKIERLINYIKQWLAKKINGKVTIDIHDGGIRGVKLEQNIK